MVESGAQQATEAEVLDAIEFGHDCCKKIATAIRELVKKVGKTKREFKSPEMNQAAVRPDFERRPRRVNGRNEYGEVRKDRQLSPDRRVQKEDRRNPYRTSRSRKRAKYSTH